jgi:tRNA A-37 threonylcarbamoyl transferase component Bud32
MHANGVEHTDLHAGNLLVSAGGELVVADLHAVNVGGRVGWSRRVACLAKFLWSIEAVLNQPARAAWMGQYGEEVGLGASARAQLASQVERKIERLRMQRFRSRTRRCLMNSSRFCLDKPPGRRIYRQRSIALDALAGLIGAHRADVRQHAPSVMSQRKRSAVTQQKLGHEDVCVKSFSVGGLVGRLSALAWRSRGKRAWIAANGLVARKVPTAEPLALVEELGWGESFLVTRYIRDAVPLKLWVKGPGAECPAASRRELVDAVAGVVRRLHEARVYADDLSAKNVLVRRAGSQWEAFIIDVDNTQLWRRLTWRRRLWNLAQLNDLTERVSPGERCRFLRAYAGPDWPLFRRDAKAIIELTQQRRERYRRRMDRIASRVPSAGACVIME